LDARNGEKQRNRAASAVSLKFVEEQQADPSAARQDDSVSDGEARVDFEAPMARL
jgi:hypothetical protein